ncbi:MAG: glutathione peroxidase [Myxococcota bacterium]
MNLDPLDGGLRRATGLPRGPRVSYDHPVRTLSGKPANLADYRGQVMLVVNTASGCAFTPQYKGLEALYRQHKDQGFAVLGFPCNQFGHQEGGTNASIATFCEINYGVTFPMFEKVDVNGPKAHPFYAQLKALAPGLLGTEAVKWNFTKFLVDREGRVLARYAPTDTPERIAADVRTAIAQRV